VGADGHSRWHVAFDGAMAWGPGSTSADVSLYRLGPSYLGTDGAFLASGGLNTPNTLNLQGNTSYIYSGASTLGYAVIISRANGDADNRFTLSNSGHMYFGDGTNPVDVQLRRYTAGYMGIEGGLRLTNNLHFDAQTLGGTILAAQAVGDSNFRFLLDNNGTLKWGPGNAAQDVNLYRAAANVLKTDDALQVAGTLTGLGDVYVSNTLIWNPPATGPNMFYGVVSGEANPRHTVGTMGEHHWGEGGAGALDTSLYRAAALVLKTNGRIESANAQEIPLQNPRVSTLAGNSFFTVKAMTNYDWGHWEFLKDVDGYIYGRLRVEGARAAPSVVISIAAAATSGVTRLALDYAKLSDGQTMDQGFSSLAAQDITVPGTSQARKDVTFGPLAAFAHGDFLIVRVYHAGAHANDTLAVNTMLAGAWLIG